jgi:7-carboxy-7-deazaguanine synthase
MTYFVKEIFYSLQGEGAQAGRAAVFCRFTGCNLWSGRESERISATCSFCDTNFLGIDGQNGGKFPSRTSLAKAVSKKWQNAQRGKPYIVCTGGEPMLQLDNELCQEFQTLGFEVAVETNGTLLVPHCVDWICVSPKAHAPLIQKSGDELKLVFPQPDAPPELFESLDFKYFFLQPMDGSAQSTNIKLAVEYCLKHPQWRLSLQTHKILGIN